MKIGDLVEYVDGDIGIVVGIAQAHTGGYTTGTRPVIIDVLFRGSEYHVDLCGLTVINESR
jgi:uncharacterized protein YkvS